MIPIRGIILDVDGTFIDSNDAHAKSWAEAMAAYGYNVAFEKVRPLIGMAQIALAAAGSRRPG